MRRFWIFLILMNQLGCAAITPPASPPVESPSLASIVERNPHYPHLMLAGRADIRAGHERILANCVITISPPGRLRFLLTDSLGAAWFLAVVNEEAVFFAAPGGGIRELYPREHAGPLRIGADRYWPDDLILHLYPGLNAEWIAAHAGHLRGDVLEVESDGARRQWAFYPDGRIRKVTVYRAGHPPAVYRYRYGAGGGYDVEVGERLLMRFVPPVPVPAPPSTVFQPPEVK